MPQHNLLRTRYEERDSRSNTRCSKAWRRARGATRTRSTTSLTAENARLTEKRDALRAALGLIQQQKGPPLCHSRTTVGNLRHGLPEAASWSDSGAIDGRGLPPKV